MVESGNDTESEEGPPHDLETRTISQCLLKTLNINPLSFESQQLPGSSRPRPAISALPGA